MQIWLPKVVADLADPADLEDEVVLGRERVAELVRVDLEQDRGRSSYQQRRGDVEFDTMQATH